MRKCNHPDSIFDRTSFPESVEFQKILGSAVPSLCRLRCGILLIGIVGSDTDYRDLQRCFCSKKGTGDLVEICRDYGYSCDLCRSLFRIFC